MIRGGLVALLLLGWPTVVTAQVVFDATAVTYAAGAGLTTIDQGTLTISAGTNRALVCQLVLKTQGVTGVTVVWDPAGVNQSLTLLLSANAAGGFGRTDLWGLVNPTTGNLIARASWTGSSDAVLHCTAWRGVDQTGGATSFPNAISATGNSTSPALTVTSAVNDATIVTAVDDSATAQISAPTQTATFTENSGALASTASAGSQAAGAATVTHAWTLSVAAQWVSVGASLHAATGGPPPCTNRTALLGAGCS